MPRCLIETPCAFGVATIGWRRATIVRVPHSAVADPNYPPVGIYPFHSGDSLVLILVFSHASWHRVTNVQGIHCRVVVLWHLEEDMHEQLVDQANFLEGNHDPLHVTLPSNPHQVSTDSGKVMTNKYQVMEYVMTHSSMALSNELGLYTTE